MKYKSDILSPVYWELEIDLVEDLKDKSYTILTDIGYENANHDNAILQYCDILNKSIKAVPRNPIFSKQFVCPNGYEKALKLFEDMVRCGKDLSIHMSEKLFEAGEKDKLFYDWGIHHFHLTARYNQDGRAKRSDYLIFAYITDDTFYFIQTYEHKDELAFSRREMIEIIDDNWPKLLDPYRLKNASLSQIINDDEYKDLRDANVNTFVEIKNNQLIVIPGGGYMLDGTSTKARIKSDHLISMLRYLQAMIIKHAPKIMKAINDFNKSDAYFMNIKLLLIIDDTHFKLIETNSKTNLYVNSVFNIIHQNKANDVFSFMLERGINGASVLIVE